MAAILPFAVCAAVSIAGALAAAMAPFRGQRVLGVLGVVAGTALMFLLLSAAFAAAIELVAGIASAVLVGIAPAGATTERPRPAWPLQVAAVACSALFGLVLIAVLGGGLADGSYPGGTFNSASVARLLFDRDVLAGVAVGGMLMAALAGAAASWRTRRR